MKFVVDAQSPRRLAFELAALGHEATHTLELTLGNRTPEGEIRKLAIQGDRVVVTKDNDFVPLLLLHGAPPKLLLISTGNISNAVLSRLVATNLKAVVKFLTENDLVEPGGCTITIHA